MKKAFSLLICFLLVLSISLTATAENFFTLNPSLFIGMNSFDFPTLYDDRYSLNFSNSNGEIGIMLPFEPIQNFSGSALVSFSVSFNSENTDLSSIIQTSVTTNYVDDSNIGRQYNIVYGSNRVAVTNLGANKLYFTHSSSSTNGGSTLNHSILNFYIVYSNIPSSQFNYYIKCSVPSSLTSAYVQASEPVILLVDGTSEEVSSSVGSIATSASSLDQGMKTLINKTLTTSATEIAAMRDVQAAIDDFKNSYTQLQTDADQSTLESLKQEVADKSNEIVNSVTDKISIDYSAIETGFNSLFTALSNHSDNATLTLPAGSVTIAGTSYTFWEEQTVSLNDVLQHDIVKMLLYPIRLIVYVGFAFYCLDFISKLESLITMNRSDI